MQDYIPNIVGWSKKNMKASLEEIVLQDRERLVKLGWHEGSFGWWFHSHCPGVKFTFRAALSMERDHERRREKARKIKELQEDCEE